MLVESGGRPDVTSVAGAQGLMQVMPFHGCATYEPAANVVCGAGILAGYIARAQGDIRHGLASYNAGPAGAARGRGWQYADRVLAHYWAALS